jgi:hypothetical protein
MPSIPKPKDNFEKKEMNLNKMIDNIVVSSMRHDHLKEHKGKQFYGKDKNPLTFRHESKRLFG